jgi:hypothetical protein
MWNFNKFLKPKSLKLNNKLVINYQEGPPSKCPTNNKILNILTKSYFFG